MSRAIATTTWLACFPRAVRARNRLHHRTWAFHLMCWMGFGPCSKRTCRWRLTLAGVPVGPCPLDEGSAGERVPGFGDGALATAFATGGRTGGEAPIAHARSRVLDPCQVAECSDEGDGHGALDATHRLEGLDDGGETPALDRLAEFSLQALASVVRCSHGSAILLEDALLGGCRTAHFRPPAPMGRPPGGTALIPDILAPQEGLHAGLGGRGLPDRLLTRAGQITDRLVLGRRDIDRSQLPGTHQPGEPGGVTAIGLDAVAHLLRDQGGGHDPAMPLLAAEIALEPGPAGPSFVDEDERCRVRGQGADQLVTVALAGADTAPEDDLGVPCRTGISHSDGLFVHIQPDLQWARVTHG